MKNAVKLIVLAVLGYVVFEMIDGFLRHRRTSGGPAGRGEAPVTVPMGPTGRVGGAAMTGGGRGVTQHTLDYDGESTSTRVGRGVVRRGE